MALSAQSATPEAVDWGAVTIPLAGEPIAADTCVLRRLGDKWLLAVIDGLGHGGAAVHASLVAREAVEAAPEADPRGILRRCSLAMKETRGAAMGVVSIDYTCGCLTWAGVGDVEGKVAWENDDGRLSQTTLMPKPGLVGGVLPSLPEYCLDLPSGALVILFTDGLSNLWTFPDNHWLYRMVPSQLASHLMTTYRKGTDDALIVVVRF